MVRHYEIFSIMGYMHSKHIHINNDQLYNSSFTTTTFSTRVNSGERFCATTRIRISFELQVS